jgi:hypothetical protein
MILHNDEHQITLLDAKIEELNVLIGAHRTLLDDVRRLESRAAGRELAFFAGRRSMARELRESGGLPQSQMGLEILFLLPDNFVEFYQGLFHRALRVGDQSVMHGRSGGVERATGTTGTVTGSDTRLQASGTGKKYKRLGLFIGNEKMLRVKDQTDKGLEQLTSAGRRAVGELEGTHDGAGGVNETRAQPRCYACNGFVGKAWRFCSMCGNKLDAAGG